MSKQKLLVIHCSATPPGMEVTKDLIHKWHIVENGWKKCGYRDLIQLTGRIINIEEFNHDDVIDPWEITNGVYGHNQSAAHICYAGGVDADLKPQDTRNTNQINSLAHYCHVEIRRHPDIEIAGHDQLAVKDCPNFDVRSFLRTIGIPDINIYIENKL